MERALSYPLILSGRLWIFALVQPWNKLLRVSAIGLTYLSISNHVRKFYPHRKIVPFRGATPLSAVQVRSLGDAFRPRLLQNYAVEYRIAGVAFTIYPPAL